MARNTREGTEATRLALITAARALFIDKGYAETATPEIVAAAGVTRGALYHHFEDKKALFRAVIEQEAATVADEIDRVSAPAVTPRDALLSGASAYFAAMAEPGRARLMLLEAPAVLGVEGTADIERENAEDRLRQGVCEYLGNGASDDAVRALTGLLSAAFDRAVLEIEKGGDRATYETAIARLIDGLIPR
ncbi:AcrR family transcriptional regulator [Peteryoungia aggregata LMG 23059]|uniref:AcrR family transcriptional regulator n=1 Tax=Peteryoungia aggregata LMG 23059 TaxID=1368425 RepID=A0ABU0G2N8_9HYPH|nr:TetR/AcrR family transcriptional regulator [Peteryoungia aggregata]MDQ0419214.1 AcrR family transcriptional regulator [Peteryoungia aggregata LMG 23059]